MNMLVKWVVFFGLCLTHPVVLAQNYDWSELSYSKASDLYQNESPIQRQVPTSSFSFFNKTVEFARLKKPLRVRIPVSSGSVLGVTDPSYLKSGSPGIYKGSYHCNYSSEITGEVVHVGSGYAAVKLDPSVKGCNMGLNKGQKEPEIVFFDSARIAPDVQDDTGSITNQSRADNLEERMSGASASQECKLCKNPAALDKIPTDKIEALGYQETKPSNEGIYSKSLVDLANVNSHFKSTEKYLACYPTPDQENYNKYLKKAIEVASSEFRVMLDPSNGKIVGGAGSDAPIEKLTSIPEGNTWVDVGPHPDVLKCLIRKESLFNPSKVSPTGARGLGQQVKKNIIDIQRILKRSWAKKISDRFYKKLNTLDPATKKFMWTNAKTKEKCSKDLRSEDDAFCPAHSLMATALYQTYLEMIVRKNFKEFKKAGDFEGNELLYVNAVIAASHNAGSGSAEKATLRIERAGEWKRMLVKVQRSGARKEEIGGYFESMKACISGDKVPMYPGDRNICD